MTVLLPGFVDPTPLQASLIGGLRLAGQVCRQRADRVTADWRGDVRHEAYVDLAGTFAFAADEIERLTAASRAAPVEGPARVETEAQDADTTEATA